MRKLANWIQGYCEFTKHLESPDVFHLWTAITTIAGALRGKVWIDMVHWKWKPNFFVIFVAPPGIASKSTALSVGMDLLYKIKGVRFGPDSATWQALTQGLIEAKEDVPGIGWMSCITCGISELGTFFDPKNREMVDILTDLWDGRERPWERSTKADGAIAIQRPWIHIHACTTPGWLQDNLPIAAIKGGFASRTLFVYADQKRRLVSYPQLEMAEAKDAFTALKMNLLHDLTIISTLKGEYRLTAEAFEYGDTWYKKHWTEKPEHMDMEMFGGYVSRKQTHVHKVAMVLAAAQRDELVIEREDLALAVRLVSSLEFNMDEVFRNISESPEGRQTSLLLRCLIYQGNKMSVKALWQRVMFRMSKDMFDQTVRGLIESGVIKLTGTGDDATLTLDRASLRRYTEEQTHPHSAGLAPSGPPGGSVH